MEPTKRDRHLRVVRLLRAGVVSAGVVGSMAVAGVVAASAPDEAAGEPSAGTPSGQEPGPDEGDVFPQQSPDLQHGFGPAHASTGGS